MLIGIRKDGTEYHELLCSYEVDEIIEFLENHRGKTFVFGAVDVPGLIITEETVQLEEFAYLEEDEEEF